MAKGFRTAAAVNADEAALEQTEIAFRDAERMLEQLVKYTGKRIVTAHRAKIQAVRADMLSLESCFRLEHKRLKRIETMIANCVMRAPRDGIVIHANPSNGSSNSSAQIYEGSIVHAWQPIFRLLDPSHIQVRAEINESQFALIRPGQPVLIHLEAFPDHPLRGSVAGIVPVPSQASALFTDVRSFFATVRIESACFDALTTGLTAELEFLIETRRRVTRVPLEAIRWIDDQPFAAALIASDTGPDWQWQWRPIALGVNNTTHAEVKSGLKPGDRVIAHCEDLPDPPMANGGLSRFRRNRVRRTNAKSRIGPTSIDPPARCGSDPARAGASRLFRPAGYRHPIDLGTGRPRVRRHRQRRRARPDRSS